MPKACPSTPQMGGNGPQGVGGLVCKLNEGHTGDHRAGAASWPNPAIQMRFRIEIDLRGGAMPYPEVVAALRSLADGLLPCAPEVDDCGTLVSNGVECGTWEVK